MPAVCGVTVYPWTTNVPRSVLYTVGQLPLPHKLVTSVSSGGGFMPETSLLSEFTREEYIWIHDKSMDLRIIQHYTQPPA
jgi:hypothetical protein